MAAGEVLVFTHARPDWAPVFAILAGIVLDHGDLADHSAITAREFGVPAVYATTHATQRIPDGAWVTVDGDAGSVTWQVSEA